jgi:hypothetical protein
LVQQQHYTCCICSAITQTPHATVHTPS